ncbi:hypothetical protein BJX65DRAFT_314774 [Aspergillus insuetus]
MKLQHVHSVLISLVQTCVATQFLTRETLPEGSFSEACVEALVADIACPLQVSRFSNGRYFPDAALVDACTPSCLSALASYGDDILSSCGESDYYEISDSDLVPAAVIPLRYRYYYNKTCIQDGDRWCHGFAREVAEAGTIATPAPVPTDIADGTVDRCAQFLLVQPGDYCNKVIIKYGISLEDFLFLNQGVNQNCTNLFAYESYCVQPAGPIDEYPGHPGYIPPDESITYLPDTEFPFATYTPGPITNQTTVLPFAPGTRRDCVLYSDGPDMQVDLGASSYDSPCELFAEMNNISLDTLSNWNPSLNGSSPDCAFDERYQYCVAPYRTLVTLPPSPTTTTETRTSTTTVTTTEPPVTTTTTVGPPGPTQSGIPANCNRWHLVVEGDTC